MTDRRPHDSARTDRSERRDAAVDRARDLTIGVALGAGAATVAFGALAAWTFAGTPADDGSAGVTTITSTPDAGNGAADSQTPSSDDATTGQTETVPGFQAPERQPSSASGSTGRRGHASTGGS